MQGCLKMGGVSVRAEIAKKQSRLSLVYVRCDCFAMVGGSKLALAG